MTTPNKPCPFCGTPSQLRETVWDGRAVVFCVNTECGMPSYHMPLKAWNRRPREEHLEGRVEDLIRGLRHLLADSALLPRREIDTRIRSILRADRIARTKAAVGQKKAGGKSRG